MKLKIFGFSFNKTNASAEIGTSDIFRSLESTPSLSSEIKIRHGVAAVPVNSPDGKRDCNWWAGIILKVRDSQTFTMLTENDGKHILTTELLKANQSLAEPSFFVANPRTGAGLFANHYQSAPLIGGLFPILLGESKRIRDEKIKAITVDGTLSPKERKKRQKELRGLLWPEQIVQPQAFKQLVASMKKVNTVKVRLSSVVSGHKLFQGCSFVPEKESCEYKLPAGALPDEVADSLSYALTHNTVASISVEGIDKRGKEASFSHDKNPYIFDEQDYDEMMNGFELDINDYIKTLFHAKVIKHLIGLARGRSLWELLNRS